MTIKNLVISGGGPILIQILGAIQQLESDKFLELANIETIYSTSAGSIVGILLCLKFDWETINDYIIKRPWQNVFTIKVENIFDAYTKKGIFDIKTIEKCFKPLLEEKDMQVNVSLEEFYNKTKIELHLYAFDINEYKVEDISYLTHPKLSLLNAIQMTCGIPVLMKPICLDNKCYIDGGISCNYPLNYAIQSGKVADEILGFKNKYKTDKNYITEESSLLDFLLNFLFKAIFSLNTDNQQPFIKNEIHCEADFMSLDILKNALSSQEIRKKMWSDGMVTASTFLENIKFIQTHEETPVVLY
jgi:predicted acylesterase/phospholipase RssA